MSIKGATAPGTPFVLLGQNDRIAWGFTTANTDTQDLFVETIDPTDPSKYLTPDGPKPFETREETIRVKDAPDVKLTIRATRHGPVLSDVSKDLGGLAGPGKAIALAFTGLGDHDTTEEAIMRLDVARELERVPRRHARRPDADAERRLRRRLRRHRLLQPRPRALAQVGRRPGARSTGRPGHSTGSASSRSKQLPQLHNPEIGFAFNANNANVPDGHQPTFGEDWEENFRARRIQQFFDTIDKHSLATSAAMQADHLSLAAKDLQPFIAMIAPTDERARQAQAMLASWNAVMDKDRPEPLIFTAFLSALHRILIEEKTGLKMEAEGPFAAKTLVSLMRDHPSWCDAPDKPDPDCRKALARALDEGLALVVKRDGADMSRWRWGAEHVALLRHKVYGHVPLLDRISDLSVPSSGSFYTLDRGGGWETADEPFARTQGAGFRGLYDLAEPEKSRFMIATGESGHILSSHYRDFLPLWSAGKSITLTGSEEDLRRAGAQELVLSP